MKKILGERFFERDAKVVAKELLGKFLVRRIDGRPYSAKASQGKEIVAMITETEAYDGPHDKASHAHRGRTKRSAPMWGVAGVWYVYLCYGMHEMLNIVTGPKEYPAAVLVRGVRYIVQNGKNIDGPGKVTKALRIGRALNGKKSEKKTELWIEDRGVKVAPRDIRRAARIGVSYAGPVWSKKKYRFFLKSDPQRHESLFR